MACDAGMSSLQSSTENKNGSVLVVDDCSIIRAVHERLLVNLGLEVQVAKDGQEAVDLHCGGASYELILMDMDMPIMNGTEATSKLRGMGVNSNIVGVTTNPSKAAHDAFKDAGANDCVLKPLTVEKIASFLP